MTELDPRIVRGTTRMLAARQEAADRGAEPFGWKAGFGAPAAFARLGTNRPLIGFLTTDKLLLDGASVDISSWAQPVLEAEVAAHMGADLGAEATSGEALAAVAGWSVAIELADVDSPPDDVEAIVAGNIFHRHVVLGSIVAARPDPLSFVVRRDDTEAGLTSQPEALTGELGFVLASMADTLAACGAGLTAGDVVITGAVLPPVAVSSGEEWQVRAPGLGGVSVHLR